jgi:hypothetical protein
MVHMRNDQDNYLIFVGPLQDDVFDKLLQMSTPLNNPNIKELVKKVTNGVTRKLMNLARYVDKLNVTSINQEDLENFENARTDDFLTIAQTYFNTLQENEKTRYFEVLTNMFLSRNSRHFEGKFLDLGLVYRYSRKALIHYLPLCPSARKALLNMFITFDLSENIRNQIHLGRLNGPDFEEALFNRLACKCKRTIQLNSMDLSNKNKSIVTLYFDDYAIIKPSGLSLGPCYKTVLYRGFDGYPRFDYMIGPIFIQVSISHFVKHNYPISTNIKQAFKPMSAQAGITNAQINGRNQIEMYLDEMYGPGHSAKIDPTTKRFVVTKNGSHVHGFRIVYICGSPSTPNHYRKVNEFPDIAHITFEEIRSQLFKNI